jgi:dTDP-4-amino-4,6-dideoxygalactose transaminase
VGTGINAKMNELQAAFGLLQLKSFREQTKKRKQISNLYSQLLKDVKGISFMGKSDDVVQNHAYFPIFVTENFPLTRDQLYFRLRENNIYGRRYFYPLISEFKPYNELLSADSGNLKEANIKAQQVICLPIYADLYKSDIIAVTELIKKI